MQQLQTKHVIMDESTRLLVSMNKQQVIGCQATEVGHCFPSCLLQDASSTPNHGGVHTDFNVTLKSIYEHVCLNVSMSVCPTNKKKSVSTMLQNHTMLLRTMKNEFYL